MAFTVRPSEEETQVIEQAAKALSQKSMSKTVITACSEMLRLNEEVALLERQLNQQRTRAESAERVIKGMQQATKTLMACKV